MSAKTLEQFLIDHGYSVPNYTVDTIVRFNPIDKPNQNKNAWMKVFSNGNAVIGNWTTGEYLVYSSTEDRLSKNEWIQVQKQREKERKLFKLKQLQRHKAIALEAQKIIKSSKPVLCNYPYLKRKGVKPHGALIGNVLNYKNVLINPVIGSIPPFVGIVKSLQIILSDGSKRFFKGGDIKGGYFIIQQVNNAPIIICESFSTGATLAEHYAQNSTVICAFSASNLPLVAKYFRKLYPAKKITIAGDNDYANKINIGSIKAKEAAKAINGLVSIPKFAENESGSDWNDRYHLDNPLSSNGES